MSGAQMLHTILAILIVGVITFGMRSFPFLLYGKSRKPPKTVLYLGKILPPAVISILVVYCFQSVSVIQKPYGIPEFVAALSVVLLHLWKRNNLLSILGGTVIYMILLQTLL